MLHRMLYPTNPLTDCGTRPKSARGGESGIVGETILGDIPEVIPGVIPYTLQGTLTPRPGDS